MKNFDLSPEESELHALIEEIEDFLDKQEEYAKRDLRRGMCILNISSCLRKAVVRLGIKVKSKDDQKSYINFLKHYIANIQKNKGENGHVSDQLQKGQ